MMKHTRSEIFTAEAIEKNAAIILKKLQRPGAVLRCFPDNQKRDDEYGIYNKAEQPAKPKGSVLKALAHIFISRGWLDKQDGEYQLSSAGNSWLKRRQHSTNTQFRDQHSDYSNMKHPETGRIVQVNDLESPLAWLRKRKDSCGKPMLDDVQFEAGEQLRRDFTFAQMAPSVTASWSLTSGGGKRRKHGGGIPAANIPDNIIEARRRVTRALNAVGLELAGVLLDVCCLFRGLGEAEKQKGWPQRSGKVVLQIALTSLARHYGLIGEAGHKDGCNSGIITWGTDDSRPDM